MEGLGNSSGISICVKGTQNGEKGVRKKEGRIKCKHTSFTFVFASQMKMQTFLVEDWCKS